MLLSDYIGQVQFLLHDQANQDFSQSELIIAINNARTAVALDFQSCRITYLTPPANVANASFLFTSRHRRPAGGLSTQRTAGQFERRRCRWRHRDRRRRQLFAGHHGYL